MPVLPYLQLPKQKYPNLTQQKLGSYLMCYPVEKLVKSKSSTIESNRICSRPEVEWLELLLLLTCWCASISALQWGTVAPHRRQSICDRAKISESKVSWNIKTLNFGPILEKSYRNNRLTWPAWKGVYFGVWTGYTLQWELVNSEIIRLSRRAEGTPAYPKPRPPRQQAIIFNPKNRH